jgi:hypothetical protein
VCVRAERVGAGHRAPPAQLPAKRGKEEKAESDITTATCAVSEALSQHFVVEGSTNTLQEEKGMSVIYSCLLLTTASND